MGNQSSCDVDLPSGVLVPGQTFMGTFKLKLAEPIDCKKITIGLIGIETQFSGFAQRKSLINVDVVVFGRTDERDKNKYTLGIGTHVFPFQFVIYANLPDSWNYSDSSILTKRTRDTALIAYKIVGTLVRTGLRSNRKMEVPISVIGGSNLHLASLPIARGHVLNETVIAYSCCGCCCCLPGAHERCLIVKGTIDKTFVQADDLTIGLKLNIENRTPFDLKKISVNARGYAYNNPNGLDSPCVHQEFTNVEETVLPTEIKNLQIACKFPQDTLTSIKSLRHLRVYYLYVSFTFANSCGCQVDANDSTELFRPLVILSTHSTEILSKVYSGEQARRDRSAQEILPMPGVTEAIHHLYYEEPDYKAPSLEDLSVILNGRRGKAARRGKKPAETRGRPSASTRRQPGTVSSSDNDDDYGTASSSEDRNEVGGRTGGGGGLSRNYGGGVGGSDGRAGPSSALTPTAPPPEYNIEEEARYEMHGLGGGGGERWGAVHVAAVWNNDDDELPTYADAMGLN